MIKHLLVFFAVALNFATALDAPSTYSEFEELIKPHGYTWEAHTVATQDSYLLTMFRITGKEG